MSKSLKLKVTITLKDDTQKTYICVDFPGFSDFVTLYLPNLTRKLIPKETISDITYGIYE